MTTYEEQELLYLTRQNNILLRKIYDKLNNQDSFDIDVLANVAGNAFTDDPLDSYFFGGKYEEEAIKQLIKTNLYIYND